MNNNQKLMVAGMDMLLKKINIHPDNKEFSVAEIIEMSNGVYKEILEVGE